MRDEKRIYPFCSELAELWSQYPDLRFGQIMYNVMKYIQYEYGVDPFYMEDDEFMDILRNQLR